MSDLINNIKIQLIKPYMSKYDMNIMNLSIKKQIQLSFMSKVPFRKLYMISI